MSSNGEASVLVFGFTPTSAAWEHPVEWVWASEGRFAHQVPSCRERASGIPRSLSLLPPQVLPVPLLQ